MLDQHVARTIRDLDVDLISLKAGINIVHDDVMRERAFVPALHGFIDTIRDRHRALPIVVATPIISPAVEEIGIATGALSLRRVRELTTQVVDARREGGDKALHLFDGLSLFGPDDVADLPDGLHPNGAGYRRIGERFYALAFEHGPFSEAMPRP
jgi:lysophospholipase L1-like esterase